MRGKWTCLVVEEIKQLRRTRRRGWVGEVEQEAGRGRGYLSRVLNGEVPRLDSEVLFCLLNHQVVDTGEFLDRIGIRLEHSPLSYLSRIPAHGSTDPLLLSLEEAACQSDEDPAPTERVSESESTLLSRLHDLDVLRFSNGEAAFEQLAPILEECAKSRSPRVLCRALSTYAEAQRLKAKFGLAARALKAGLHTGDRISREHALCLQRVGYLLANHGWLKAAEELAVQAIEACVLCDDRGAVGKMLFSRARMVSRQGDFLRALPFYRSSLSYLDESDWIHRVSVHHAIAWCCSQSGDLSSAQEALEVAATAHRTRQGRNWLKISWLQGIIAIQQGKPEFAEACLKLTVNGLREQADSNPVNLALASLHLCKALLLRRKPAEVLETAQGMIKLLTPLCRNPIASAAILHFYDMAQLGKATVHLIEQTILQIEESRGSGRAKTPAIVA